MNGTRYVLTRVHHGENELNAELLRLAARHHAEHEIHHVARDLAQWSKQHIAHIAKAAAGHGVDLSDSPSHPHALTTRVRAVVNTALHRRADEGLTLLEDLQHVHLQAAENSLSWELLAQYAKATRDQELSTLAADCHPQTLRQMRWANSTLKIQCPQVLASL